MDLYAVVRAGTHFTNGFAFPCLVSIRCACSRSHSSTGSCLLQALVTPANVQDRDGGALLFTVLGERVPWLAKLFADGAYQGRSLHKPWPQSAPSSSSRSSREGTKSKAVSCCPNAGLWNAR